MNINWFDLILKIFVQLFRIFSIFFIPLIFFVVILFLIFVYNYFYFKVIKHIKPIKNSLPKVKHDNILKNIFWLFPKQLAYDFLTQDPDSFNEFGIHMICGEQGSGKTITAVYLMNYWRKKYPRLKTYTNMEYQYQDGDLGHWRDLISRNNGIYGVVNCIDEIHTWFSSKESKDLPPDVLGEISQQRKQKKAIIGTAQVFGKIAKPLREQSHFVYKPYTFLGCLTICFKTKAIYYDIEKDRFKKYTGFFIFAHTKELRTSYDTYKRISRYTEQEFAPSIYNGTAPFLEASDK